MYSEFLGENYHDGVRKILVASKGLVPDSMIDADANIGAMRGFISPYVMEMDRFGMAISGNDNPQFSELSKAARYYLAAILCVPLRNRSKRFGKGYANWDKKRVRCMQKATDIMFRLMRWQKPRVNRWWRKPKYD